MPAALALLLARAVAAAPADDRRVIGFHVDNSQWKYYDWSALTTVSSFSHKIDPDMVATAHKHGVRVTMSAQAQPTHIRDASSRKAWIDQKVVIMQQFGLDGINIDIEKQFFEREALTSLTNETAAAVKAVCPKCTVAFDVTAFTWFDAFYDFGAIAAACDYVVLMAYDMGALNPAASPNTPAGRMHEVVAGFLRWIPRSKLVLGLAWYGYDYPCSRGLLLGKCLYDWPINVSGHQRSFTDLLLRSRNASLQPTAVRRASDSDSLTFRYKEADASGKLLTHEVWFDNATTLADKAGFAAELSLSGVAVWDLNSVQYGGSDPVVSRSTQDMWKVLRSYLHDNSTAKVDALVV